MIVKYIITEQNELPIQDTEEWPVLDYFLTKPLNLDYLNPETYMNYVVLVLLVNLLLHLVCPCFSYVILGMETTFRIPLPELL